MLENRQTEEALTAPRPKPLRDPNRAATLPLRDPNRAATLPRRDPNRAATAGSAQHRIGQTTCKASMPGKNQPRSRSFYGAFVGEISAFGW